MRRFAVLLLGPALVLAQASFPTDFPAESVSLSADTLKLRLTGKSFTIKPAVGNEIRLQYQDKFAFVNVGNANDSGTWKTEGSSLCTEWRKFPSTCSEVRLLGDVMYLKRSNGEVVVFQPK